MTRSSRWLWLFVAASLFAAACSGEVDDGTEDTEESTSEEGTSSTEATEDPGSTEVGTEQGGGDGSFDFAAYEDPRGEPFTSFQASMERNDPFSSLEDFCVAHPEAADRADTDPGITADSIEIHHIRSELEKLVDLGFGVDVGEPKLMFEVFVDVINEQCGGIRGRTLDLGLSEYNPADPAAEDLRVASCLEATEDRDSVLVLNSTGFQGAALLCITEEHATGMITTQGLSEEFYERGQSRLFSIQEGLEESMIIVAETAIDDGVLDGRTVAVVGADTPGQPEAVDGLVAALEAGGVEVVVNEILGCNGGVTCNDGLETAVASMVSAEVDAVFAPLGILSLPGFVSEMATQGYAAGDAIFFNGNANSQDGDLVSSKIVEFGGDDAAALYNGATIVSASATGTFNFEEEVPVFNQMCLDTFAANGGVAYDYFDREENTRAGMVATVCALMRTAARALWQAGENPTRDDVYDALSNLGPIDTNQMIPGSFTAGDQAAPDVAQRMAWTSPCEIPDGAFDDNDTCIVSSNEWFEAFD